MRTGSQVEVLNGVSKRLELLWDLASDKSHHFYRAVKFLLAG